MRDSNRPTQANEEFFPLIPLLDEAFDEAAEFYDIHDVPVTDSPASVPAPLKVRGYS